MNNIEKTKKSLSDRSIISDSILPLNQSPLSFNRIQQKITQKTISFKKSMEKNMPIRIKRFIKKHEPKMSRSMPPEYLKKFYIIKRKVRSPIIFRNRLKKHLRIKRVIKRLYPNMARKMCPESLKKFIVIKKKLRVPIKFRKRIRIICSRPPIMSMPSPGKPKSYSFTNQFQDSQYKKSLSPFKESVKWDLKDDILSKVREQHP